MLTKWPKRLIRNVKQFEKTSIEPLTAEIRRHILISKLTTFDTLPSKSQYSPKLTISEESHGWTLHHGRSSTKSEQKHQRLEGPSYISSNSQKTEKVAPKTQFQIIRENRQII